MTVSTKCRLCGGRSILDTPTIRVVAHSPHIRAYYCQNCFKHIVEWVRQQYPQFMRKGKVRTAYYATMLGLAKPSTQFDSVRLGRLEMDDRVLAPQLRHVDSSFDIEDVPEPAPLSHFFPAGAELERVKEESRKEMIT